MPARSLDLRDTERWIAWVRLGGVAFALFQLTIVPDEYPPGREAWAWGTTAVLGFGAVAFWFLSRRSFTRPVTRLVGALALIFDTAIVSTYVLVFSFEAESPIRQLLFVPLVEAALRYGLRGGLLLPVLLTPVFIAHEHLRPKPEGGGIQIDNVTFSVGVQALTGLIVGWLVERLATQTYLAGTRAAEAERLRDALGRRVDLLEAANRCARALGSSLVLEQAFQAFIRELRGLVAFERTAIVLAENGAARVIAASGAAAEEVFPPGSAQPIEGTVLELVLRGEAVYREDMADTQYAEEQAFLDLGLRCRLATPLVAGSRTIGMLSLVRREPSSFTPEEIELLTLLGRLVATGVQNIRAYEAERTTVEELRRLSALRADFVSLVSHELRTPMAAVIGSARTLQQRWRELTAEQRESFLALIAGETSRLADLIADVLDTSRIEAGTFTYSFSDVDVAELVREVVAAAELGQDEVRLRARVSEALPAVRGDRERLRQVLANLVDNAVKYSPTGDEVEITAQAVDGSVRVEVSDRGPGIAREHQNLIFEKFGRAKGQGKSLPGTGLGLFIARSIAEAHGGSLDVRSAPHQGATFTLALPAEGEYEGLRPRG